MKCLAAYTGPTPATGYVGYINISQNADGVHFTIRPESADALGSAVVVIPPNEAQKLLSVACAALAKEASDA